MSCNWLLTSGHLVVVLCTCSPQLVGSFVAWVRRTQDSNFCNMCLSKSLKKGTAKRSCASHPYASIDASHESPNVSKPLPVPFLSSPFPAAHIKQILALSRQSYIIQYSTSDLEPFRTIPNPWCAWCCWCFSSNVSWEIAACLGARSAAAHGRCFRTKSLSTRRRARKASWNLDMMNDVYELRIQEQAIASHSKPTGSRIRARDGLGHAI